MLRGGYKALMVAVAAKALKGTVHLKIRICFCIFFVIVGVCHQPKLSWWKMLTSRGSLLEMCWPDLEHFLKPSCWLEGDISCVPPLMASYNVKLCEQNSSQSQLKWMFLSETHSVPVFMALSV